MRKHLPAILMLSILSTSAYATKARLQGLGEDVEDGTFYIHDDRAVFMNAAQVNNYSNKMLLEWGNQATATAGASSADTIQTTEAQGGMFFKTGNLNYGIYLGNESNTANLLRISADSGATPNFNKNDNVVDLFVGGGSDLMWGASFNYAKYEDMQGANQITDDAMGIRLGVMKDLWEAYANVSLKGEAEDKVAQDKFDGKGAYHLGGSYGLNEESKIFASYKTSKWDIKQSTTTYGASYSRIDAGYGLTKEMGIGTLYTSLRFNTINVEVKHPSGTATFKRKIIPIQIGYEFKANSWLTLRTGISQNLYGEVDQKNLANINATARTLVTSGYGNAGKTADGKSSFIDSSNVNAGATFDFGTISLDGVLGYNTALSAENGKFNLTDMMARVGMTYNF